MLYTYTLRPQVDRSNLEQLIATNSNFGQSNLILQLIRFIIEQGRRLQEFRIRPRIRHYTAAAYRTSTSLIGTRREAIYIERLDLAYLVDVPLIAATNIARTLAINLSSKTLLNTQLEINLSSGTLLNNQLIRRNNILLPKRRRPNRPSYLSGIQRYNYIASYIRNYLYRRAINSVDRAYSIYCYRLDNTCSNIDDTILTLIQALPI